MVYGYFFPPGSISHLKRKNKKKVWKEKNPFFCESQTPQTVWETKFTVNENLSRVATLTIHLQILFYYYFHFFALTLSHIDTAANQAVLCFYVTTWRKAWWVFPHLPAAHIGASRPDPTRPDPARPGSGLWQTSWRLCSGTPVVCWEASSPGSRLGVSRRPVFVPQNESPDGPFTGGRCRAAAGNIWPSHPYLASWRNLPKSTGTRHRGFLFFLLLEDLLEWHDRNHFLHRERWTWQSAIFLQHSCVPMTARRLELFSSSFYYIKDPCYEWIWSRV